MGDCRRLARSAGVVRSTPKRATERSEGVEWRRHVVSLPIAEARHAVQSHVSSIVLLRGWAAARDCSTQGLQHPQRIDVFGRATPAHCPNRLRSSSGVSPTSATFWLAFSNSRSSAFLARIKDPEAETAPNTAKGPAMAAVMDHRL